MKGAATLERMAIEPDRRISAVVKREQSRLQNFIHRRVPDRRDARDILQDVFYELVEANHLLMPIEHLTGWLFRVARNRITDLFSEKKPESFSNTAAAHKKTDDDEFLRLHDLLPSPDAGPDALYARIEDYCRREGPKHSADRLRPLVQGLLHRPLRRRPQGVETDAGRARQRAVPHLGVASPAGRRIGVRSTARALGARSDGSGEVP